MEKNTILYFGGFMLPDKNAAAHRVIANAKALTENGYKVKLIGTTKDSGSKYTIEKLHSDFEDIELYSIPYPKTQAEWLKHIISINYIKALIDESVKYVIFYNFQSLAFLRVHSFLKKNKIKSVADCTEWYGAPKGNFIKKLIKSFDTFLRMRVINKYRIDGIITISKFLEDYYKQQNTLLVPPLIDKEDPKWQDFIDENKFISENIIKFIYAGQLGGQKDNINTVISVINNLQKLTENRLVLNIIGVDNENLKLLLEGQPIPDFVYTFGRISHLETLKKVKESDFVIFFREKNRINNAGFPTKFIEAISCGTPVITNDTSNIKDYIRNGVNGFILPENQKEKDTIMRQIAYLNKNSIYEMKLLNRNDFSFDYKNYVEHFKLFLESL